MQTPWSLLPNSQYDALLKQRMADMQAASAVPGGGVSPLNQEYLQRQAEAMVQAGGKDPTEWRASHETDDTQKKQNILSTTLRMSPEEYRSLEKTVMGSPAYKDQEQGINQLQQMVGLQAKYSPVNFDTGPLQKLANYVTGKNVPETPARTPDWSALSGAMGEIQKRRGDLYKSLKEGINSTKAGTNQDLLLSTLLTKDASRIGSEPPKGNSQDSKESAIAHRAHTQLMSKLAGDKILNQELGGYVTQSNALSALTNADHLTVQTINDAQQALRRGIQLGSGSQSGVDERAETYVRGMGFDWDKVMQFLNNKPEEVSKDHPLVESIKDLAAIEQKNMQSHFGKRLDALTGGFSWIYNDPRFSDQAATPYDNLKSSLMNALGGYHNLTSQSGPSYTKSAPTSSGIKDKFLNALKALPAAGSAPEAATPAPVAPLKDRLMKALQDLPRGGQ